MILLVSFSAVFFFSNYIAYQTFPERYIDENIDAIKESIMLEQAAIQNGTSLRDTSLFDLSSETSFLLIDDFVITESIGPEYVEEDNLVDFIIGLDSNEATIEEGNLTYYSFAENDIYRVDYIYEFDFGDYLIISTRLQSLTNVDRVLNVINFYESIAQIILIIFLSGIISFNIARPLKRINAYAKDISDLKFDSTLNINRKDEFRDLVSSLNEMTYNLQRAYQQLEDANYKLSHQIDIEKEQERQKQEFIMTINHELKTPLAVMKGMIEGMIDQVGRYKDKEKYLPELLKQIETIERITGDFTFRLRLEDKMTKGETSSSDVIQHAVAKLFILAEQSGITIKLSLDNANVIMNQELLDILTTNLVKNAITYTTGSIVEVTGVTINGMFHLNVRNKGVIDPSDLAHIFDSFYRADGNQKDGTGTGLGLFIVKEICELYDYEYKLFNDNGYVVAKIKIPTQS